MEFYYYDAKGKPTSKENAQCVEIVTDDGSRSYMEKDA